MGEQSAIDIIYSRWEVPANNQNVPHENGKKYNSNWLLTKWKKDDIILDVEGGKPNK